MCAQHTEGGVKLMGWRLALTTSYGNKNSLFAWNWRPAETPQDCIWWMEAGWHEHEFQLISSSFLRFGQTYRDDGLATRLAGCFSLPEGRKRTKIKLSSWENPDSLIPLHWSIASKATVQHLVCGINALLTHSRKSYSSRTLVHQFRAVLIVLHRKIHLLLVLVFSMSNCNFKVYSSNCDNERETGK